MVHPSPIGGNIAQFIQTKAILVMRACNLYVDSPEFCLYQPLYFVCFDRTTFDMQRYLHRSFRTCGIENRPLRLSRDWNPPDSVEHEWAVENSIPKISQSSLFHFSIMIQPVSAGGATGATLETVTGHCHRWFVLECQRWASTR